MPGKIYDISVDICKGMLVYPKDPRFRSRQIGVMENDGYNLHKIMMSNHTGTHIDAPSHFVADGATITDLPLELMNGRARVVEIHHPEKIDVPELEQLMLMDDFRILFKTRNSLLWKGRKKFKKEYVYLTERGALYLVENGIKLVGFDYVSIDRYTGNSHFPVHRILLENQVILLEGLNLSEVEEETYELSCLPLRLTGLDAAPARAILRK